MVIVCRIDGGKAGQDKLSGFQVQVDFAAGNKGGLFGQAFAAEVVIAVHDLTDPVGEGVGQCADAEVAADGNAQRNGNDDIVLAETENKSFDPFLASARYEQIALDHNP